MEPKTPHAPALLLWGVPELRRPVATRFTAERRFQLLALLALAEGAWVERDRIAALLWPEASTADGRRNLRKVLFMAHELVGAGGVQASAQALCWPVATDVAAFVAGVGHDAAAALAWRRGSPLQGLDDARNSAWSAWLAAERARLEQLWLATAHAALQAATGPVAQAAAARRLLAVEPLDGTAMAALLRAELAQGRASQAQTEYRRYAALLAQELGVNPSHALRDLLTPPSAATAGPPVAEERFVGRRQELNELQARLAQPGCRLVTLLGPGGVGKSSLARQLLLRSADLFPGGRHWLPLLDAASIAELPARWAQCLRLPLPEGADPLTALLRQMPATRSLVVLDNAEHLLADLPAPLQRALDAAPQLVLLLTSRARLGLPAETTLPLAGLAVPDEDSQDLEAAASFDAVRLFEQRARAAQRGFALAPHLAAVLEITQALGGLPLALELAASWVRLLPPEQIAADLRGGLDLLEHDPAGGAPLQRPEHASLRGVLQASWQMLGPHERALLAALSLFQGGFTRAAAQAVAGGSMPLLSALVDVSLLAVDDSGRFALHPVVQGFAAERLAEDAPRRAALAERHAAHFAELLAGWAPLVRTQPQQLARQMAAEEANARAAWQHALDAAHSARLLQMLPAWRGLFETSGRFDEGLTLLRTLLQQPEADLQATRLLSHARQVMCALLYQRGHAAEALRFAEAGIDSAQRCAERVPLKGCLNTAALALYLLGRSADALPHARRMLAECEADGDRYGIVVALSTGAIATTALGQFETALADLQRALGIAQELGHAGQIGHLYNIIGNTQRALARWGEARASLEAGLRHCEQQGLAAGMAFCSVNLALAEIELGELDTAQRRLGALLQRLEQVPQQQVTLDAELGLARIEARRGQRHELRLRLRRIEALARQAAQPVRRLQTVLVWAEALLQEGRRGEGLPLLRWLAEQPALEMADRLAAQRQLDAAGGPPGGRWTHDLEATLALMRADTA